MRELIKLEVVCDHLIPTGWLRTFNVFTINTIYGPWALINIVLTSDQLQLIPYHASQLCVYYVLQTHCAGVSGCLHKTSELCSAKCVMGVMCSVKSQT